MDVGVARLLDKYVGYWICLALVLMRRLPLLSGSEPVANLGPARRILVVKFWGIGSIALCTPALRALRQHYPGAHITFLTFAQNRSICEATGLIDTVQTIDNRHLFALAADTLRLLLPFGQPKYDLILDFEFLARYSSIVSFLLPGRVKVEFSSPFRWRGNLIRNRMMYNVHHHVTRNFLDLLQVIGIAGGGNELVRFSVQEKARTSLTLKLAELSVPDKDMLLVNINASGLAYARRWPRELFGILLHRLRECCKLPFVLIGGPDDVEYVNDFMSRQVAGLSGVYSLAGALNWAEYLALLERACLLVSNDSGPLHVAAAQGIATVSFYGPETPVMYKPVGKNHRVFFADRFCSPCMRIDNLKSVDCPYNQACLREIDPATVVEAVLNSLNSAATPAKPCLTADGNSRSPEDLERTQRG